MHTDSKKLKILFWKLTFRVAETNTVMPDKIHLYKEIRSLFIIFI